MPTVVGALSYFKGVSYVLPGAVIGQGTRNSVIRIRYLKNNQFLKGVSEYRYFSTQCNIDKSEKKISDVFIELEEASKTNDIAKVNTLVKFLLSNKEFWIGCYDSIKSNPGGMALGGNLDLIKKSQTYDNLDLEWFIDLSSRIKSGKFHFGPIRRVEINKSDGKTRFLGIAPSRDKIVQKGLAVILELVSEYRFYEGSFGFRKKLSTHDAIRFIKKKVPSGVWAIEGDISKCFDSFKHNILVSIIKKNYVSLQIFCDLIYKAIKAKVIRLTSTFITKVGTPQGSILSPILCNIYLHEFDMFVTQSEVLKKFRSQKRAIPNYEYTKFIKLTEEEKKDVEAVRKSRGKRKMWKHLHILRKKKLKIANRLGLKSSKHNGSTRKIAYVRYADDFLIFVWGTKQDSLEITELCRKFLESRLHLNLSQAKTQITYLKKDKAKFLGFEIWQSKSHIWGIKKDVNPKGELDRYKMNSQYRAAVRSIPRIRITFRVKHILQKLVDKGLAKIKGGKFLPTSYKPALHLSIGNIILYLKSVFFGIANYYSCSDNWYNSKQFIDYWGKYCAFMTIAHKTKSKVPKVMKKYGIELCFSYSDGYEAKRNKICFGSSASIKNRLKDPDFLMTPERDITQLLLKNLRIGRMNLLNWNCIFCGEKAEMHHVKHVRKVLKSKKKGSYNYYLEAMRAINRKVIPVCKKHHQMIHKGEYDGVKLSKVFERFKEGGIGYNKIIADKVLKKFENRESTSK